MSTRIVCYRDLKGRKDFLTVPAWHLYRKEKKYLSDELSPKYNPVFKYADGAYFVAYNGYKPVGRVLVWRNEEAGHFSLLWGDCLQELLEEAEKYLKALGCRYIVGPVGSGRGANFMGVTVQGDCGEHALLTGQLGWWSGPALRKLHYEIVQTALCCEITVPSENKWKDTARRAARRYGLTVRQMRRGIGRFALPSVVHDVEWSDQVGAALEAERLLPMVKLRYCLCVHNEHGECLGYILTLAHKWNIRVATIMTKEGIYTPPVTTLLVSELTDRLIEDGVGMVEASVIFDNNLPSKMVLVRLGAKFRRRIGIFQKSIT